MCPQWVHMIQLRKYVWAASLALGSSEVRPGANELTHLPLGGLNGILDKKFSILFKQLMVEVSVWNCSVMIGTGPCWWYKSTIYGYQIQTTCHVELSLIIIVTVYRYSSIADIYERSGSFYFLFFVSWNLSPPWSLAYTIWHLPVIRSFEIMIL